MKNEKQVETVVIGSGPGGYVSAIRASQLGKKVTIIEAEEIGGVCLNVGCIPSKALITAGHRYQESLHSEFLGLSAKEVTLDFSQTQAWKEKQVVQPLTQGVAQLLKKNNVEIIKGYATFQDAHHLVIEREGEKQVLAFQEAIIATGSRPIEIPEFAFSQRILDSTGALNLTEIPEKLVVIGGGVIGVELGSAYANLGAKVTILEGSNQLLPGFEQDMVAIVAQELKRKGVQYVLNAFAKKVEESNHQVAVTYEVSGKQETIDSSYVLVSVGRKPNTDRLGLENIRVEKEKNGWLKVNNKYQTSVPSIFAIGDVIEGLALAHKASYDAKIVAEVIAGKKVVKDYRAIPGICYSDCELATVGLTREQATVQGKQVVVAQFPLQANGRALSMHATKGFVRIISDAKDQTILGGQIVGIQASELITEVTLAIENSLTLEDIALTIHGHPTLSEAIMDTVEVGLGLPIHF